MAYKFVYMLAPRTSGANGRRRTAPRTSGANGRRHIHLISLLNIYYRISTALKVGGGIHMLGTAGSECPDLADSARCSCDGNAA